MEIFSDKENPQLIGAVVELMQTKLQKYNVAPSTVANLLASKTRSNRVGHKAKSFAEFTIKSEAAKLRQQQCSDLSFSIKNLKKNEK